MSEYDNLIEDEKGWSKWFEPSPERWLLACCDCGLVHDVQFRVTEGKLSLRFSRNKRSTAMKRYYKAKRAAEEKA